MKNKNLLIIISYGKHPAPMSTVAWSTQYFGNNALSQIHLIMNLVELRGACFRLEYLKMQDNSEWAHLSEGKEAWDVGHTKAGHRVFLMHKFKSGKAQNDKSATGEGRIVLAVAHVDSSDILQHLYLLLSPISCCSCFRFLFGQLPWEIVRCDQPLLQEILNPETQR